MHEEDENVTLGRLTITRKCCGSGTCRNYAPSLLEEVPSANAKRDGHRLRTHTPLPRWIIFALSRTKPKTLLSRLVRALGNGCENWVLPRSSWSSLPDHDVSLTATAVKRALLLGSLGAAAVATLATAIALGVAR